MIVHEAFLNKGTVAHIDPAVIAQYLANQVEVIDKQRIDDAALDVIFNFADLIEHLKNIIGIDVGAVFIFDDRHLVFPLFFN